MIELYINCYIFHHHILLHVRKVVIMHKYISQHRAAVISHVHYLYIPFPTTAISTLIQNNNCHLVGVFAVSTNADITSHCMATDPQLFTCCYCIYLVCVYVYIWYISYMFVIHHRLCIFFHYSRAVF